MIKNKTLMYIVPGLSLFNKIISELILKYENMIYGFFIQENNLLLVVKKGHQTALLYAFLSEFVDSEYQGKEEVIALKVPKGCNIKAFKDGFYSKIYSRENLNTIFKGERRNLIAYHVMMKTSTGKSFLAKKLKDEFGTVLSNSEIDEFKEYDTPPLIEEESYKKSSKGKTFFFSS